MKITKRQLRRIIREAISPDASDEEIVQALTPHVQAGSWDEGAKILLAIFPWEDLPNFLDESELASLMWERFPKGTIQKLEDAAWKIESKRQDDLTTNDPDRGWLEFLGNEWTSSITPEDLPSIGWKEYKNYIRLSPPASISHAMGEIHIMNHEIEGSGMGTRQDFVDFLTQRAGKPLKKRKIYRSPPPVYD
jgi:hypothetical protein